MNTFCAIGLWQLLDSKAHGYMGTAEEHLQVSVLGLRYALNTWYQKRAQLYPKREAHQAERPDRPNAGDPGNTKVQKAKVLKRLP